MKKLIVFITLVVTAFAQGPALQADIIVSLSDVTVNAGSTAVVTASIADTSGAPAELSAYNITLAVDTDSFPGFSFPGLSGFSSSTAVFSNFDPQTDTAGAMQNFDFLVSDSGGNLQLSATGTDLFQIEFEVAADAAPGSLLPVSFVQDPSAAGGAAPQPGFFSFSLDGTTVNGADLPGLVVNSGSVTVAAVPEPSSMALIMTVFGGLALRRRRS